MTRVALLAESKGHHPDWSNSWNTVDIALTTHAAGSTVTDADRRASPPPSTSCWAEPLRVTTARSSRARARPVPRGRVVAGCFIVLAVSSGLGFYGLAVYLNAFGNEKGWPVASISLATTVYFIVGGVSGLLVARVIARRDVRIPIVAGGILGGVSLAVLGQVQERWQLYLVYAVFALGFSGAGLIPVTTVVARWYHVGRSVKLSVASTGLSAGGIVLTPAAKWLIDDRGLAAATPILGVVWVIGIVPIALWFIRPDPAALGWLPDGERVQVDVPPPAPTGDAVPRGDAQPLLHLARPSPTCSCSAPRSVASSSSSSSSRTAPTPSTAALATIALAGTSVCRPARRRPRRVPGADVAVRAGLAAPRRCRWPLIAFASDGDDLPRHPPVRRHRRQPPDAAAAADGRALRRPRLPPHLQPGPVHLDGRHRRRPAPARLALRQRRRLRDVVPRRRGCSLTGAVVLAAAGPAPTSAT